MRRALEQDQYSALGSIVETESDDEDTYLYHGEAVRLDKTALHQAWKKKIRRLQNAASKREVEEEEEEEDEAPPSKETTLESSKPAPPRKTKKRRGGKDEAEPTMKNEPVLMSPEEDLDRDGGSIFGQTTGSSNATWVECDKCKKCRRLRGVVDEKKLPSKWYCSMNKNDPERARCAAPEEAYEAPHTPESAADARVRKHLRVWVRRLQCNEAYESRMPTLTRGKKRAAVANSKDPYEWVRCCNPSCGKWRAILRIMDARTHVMDRNKEWYCVMNTWDEKMASCAAPQENLPAVGCPPWVMQDDD